MVHPSYQPHLGCQMVSLFASELSMSSLVGGTGPTRIYHVEQKEVGKECQPSAIGPAQRLIVAVRFTVSEKVCQSCGHPLFSKVSEVNGDLS
jgi:hypothetical protein